MKTRHLAATALLLALAAAFSPLAIPAFGQAPAASTIEKTEISGISDDKLSAALRADLAKLVGQPYNATNAAQIAERIQSELPEYVATTTTAPRRIGRSRPANSRVSATRNGRSRTGAMATTMTITTKTTTIAVTASTGTAMDAAAETARTAPSSRAVST